MTVEEKAKIIIKDIKNEKGNDPCKMFRNIVKNEYINIHGPAHHILDGACLLMAFYNAGGKIDIDAALAIIDGTGPLSTDGTWGNHMQVY